MPSDPQTAPNSEKTCGIMLTKAEIKLLLRLRSLKDDSTIMLYVRDGVPNRLIVMPKTEVLA